MNEDGFIVSMTADAELNALYFREIGACEAKDSQRSSDRSVSRSNTFMQKL